METLVAQSQSPQDFCFIGSFSFYRLFLHSYEFDFSENLGVDRWFSSLTESMAKGRAESFKKIPVTEKYVYDMCVYQNTQEHL